MQEVNKIAPVSVKQLDNAGAVSAPYFSSDNLLDTLDESIASGGINGPGIKLEAKVYELLKQDQVDLAKVALIELNSTQAKLDAFSTFLRVIGSKIVTSISKLIFTA